MSKTIKFGQHLKELRIHLCQKGESSKGIREFIEQCYVSIKSNNPNSPILIRECSGIQPRLWARYEYGKESSVSLANMKSSDIMKQLELLTSK